MNDQTSRQQTQSDLQRRQTWLSGEVRVSHAILVTGGALLFVVAGVALEGLLAR